MANMDIGSKVSTRICKKYNFPKKVSWSYRGFVSDGM